ncbi:hypothetical protein [Noviherbaspirillum pedocola]|uniref:Uncharacterized protein n=1 Tax=Noviherbaspirillum pedocola TaxID=2801341 RepID=A0A934W1W0_9BURK|nr:hypothetical protein [Noviherbaspirillum pedocola]MBK4735641.1 hypothetical protein [Noviherbaspirillum pedocola]
MVKAVEEEKTGKSRSCEEVLKSDRERPRLIRAAQAGSPVTHYPGYDRCDSNETLIVTVFNETRPFAIF